MARSAERFPCRSIQIQRKYEAKFDKGLLRIKLPKPADTLPLVRSNWSKPGRFADDMRTAPTEPLE